MSDKKLWYVHCAQDLVQLQLALGNPEGLAQIVADEFMVLNPDGGAYYWDDLKKKISEAARSVVFKAVQKGTEQGGFDLCIDSDGDFAIQ